MANARTEDFRTPLGRLSYAQTLFKPRAEEEGKDPKYRRTMIFPKAARAELEKRVAETIVAEWGPKGIEKAKAGLIKSPFLAGDGKEARNKQSGELHPGMGPDVFFIRPSANKDRPPAVWWKDPNKQEDETTVYSGCYGKAILNCFAWHNDKRRRRQLRYPGLPEASEGERLGGAGPIDKEKWSETIADEGEAPAETAGGKGAGGLFGD